MNQPETRDFRRKNYFAIPCFYDSHLHLEGLGKYNQKKDLTSLKSFENIKAFLMDHLATLNVNLKSSESSNTSSSVIHEVLTSTRTLSSKTHEAFGLSSIHTQDLNQLAKDLDQNGFGILNLYWVLEDGHQLLVYGDVLQKFKTSLKLSSVSQDKFKALLNNEIPIWVFDDSTRNVFDDFYTQSEFKSNDSKMETHFLTAQSILLNAGVTHCRDLTSSLEQIQCLDQLYKDQRFHLYTETYFSDFFGDSVSNLIQSSNEASEFLKSLTTRSPSFKKEDQEATSESNRPVNKLTHRGIKIFLDGTFSQGTANLTCFHNHNDDSGCTSGERKYTVSDLMHFLKEASNNNLEIAFHSMGDGAVEMILKAFDEVKTKFNTKLNLEHCEIINKPTLEYLKNLDPKYKSKVVFHFQPSHFLMDHDTLLNIQSQNEEHYKIFAWSTLLRLGYKVHFGSDAPVVKPGLHFLNDPKIDSFFRSQDDYSLFWSTFTHPEYKSNTGTFALFNSQNELTGLNMNLIKLK